MQQEKTFYILNKDTYHRVKSVQSAIDSAYHLKSDLIFIDKSLTLNDSEDFIFKELLLKYINSLEYFIAESIDCLDSLTDVDYSDNAKIVLGFSGIFESLDVELENTKRKNGKLYATII